MAQAVNKNVLPKEMARAKKTSLKDTRCEFCGRFFTARGVKEHMRHHCHSNPNRRKRKFEKVTCVHCGKVMHSAGLRVHVASVHPEKYVRSRSVSAHRVEKRPKSGARSDAPRRHLKSPRRYRSTSPVRDIQTKDVAKSEDNGDRERTRRIWKEIENRDQPLRGNATLMSLKKRS